jgi:uncharacterized membrane protein YbhN (UPF0104 family)
MRTVKLIIAVGLTVYLLNSCNLALLISTLSSINGRLACLAVIMSLLLFFGGALNLWLLLNSICHIPVQLFLYSYSYGYAVNLFAPGQLGDISLTLFLKKHGIYYSRSTLAYAIDKCISMLCILLLGYIGTIFMLNNFAAPIWIFGIPLILSICAMICILVLAYLPYDAGKIGRAKHFIRSMYKEAALWDAKYKAIILNIMLTIIKWLVLSLTYYIAFRAFGIEAKWPEVGIIPVIATLIGYIPISVGGIGTVELCAVYLFSLISIDRVYVIDVYIFLRFITYLQAGVILGLCNWQFRRARRNVGLINQEPRAREA